MKKIVFVLIGLISMLSSCSFENIDDNQVAVVIKRPYLFGSDGSEVLSPGRYCIAMSSKTIPFDATPQRYKETLPDLTTKDKSNVDFDVNFLIKIMEDSANVLYGNFGLEWYIRNLQPEFRRVVRRTSMRYDMELITSDEKSTSDFEIEVLEECRQIIKSIKIPVQLCSVNLGSAVPPNEVLEERNKTASQKQREKTLIQENINLDQYEKNERKRASGDKAYQNELQLTVDQYINLKTIEAKKIAYEKATTVIVNETDAKTSIPLR